jgi:hypothetical protein
MGNDILPVDDSQQFYALNITLTTQNIQNAQLMLNLNNYPIVVSNVTWNGNSLDSTVNLRNEVSQVGNLPVNTENYYNNQYNAPPVPPTAIPPPRNFPPYGMNPLPNGARMPTGNNGFVPSAANSSTEFVPSVNSTAGYVPSATNSVAGYVPPAVSTMNQGINPNMNQYNTGTVNVPGMRTNIVTPGIGLNNGTNIPGTGTNIVTPGYTQQGIGQRSYGGNQNYGDLYNDDYV